jgi:hypothetical protein
VPEAEEGGVNAELQYVEVNQDPEEPQANVADEGKHQSINLSIFGNYATIFECLYIYVQELEWNPRCMILRCPCLLLVC